MRKCRQLIKVLLFVSFKLRELAAFNSCCFLFLNLTIENRGLLKFKHGQKLKTKSNYLINLHTSYLNTNVQVTYIKRLLMYSEIDLQRESRYHHESYNHIDYKRHLAKIFRGLYLTSLINSPTLFLLSRDRPSPFGLKGWHPYSKRVEASQKLR